MELNSHLPTAFDFYGLGQVKKTSSIPRQTAGITKVTVSGDIDGTILVRFDVLPDDTSLCLELTNILSAKIVNSLYDADGLLVELSPPAYVDAEEKAYDSLMPLFTVSGAMAGNARRSYSLSGINSGINIKMELIFLPQRRGNA